MLYSTKPGQAGSFVPPVASGGYYNLSQNLPWYHGRSVLASIPEYMRSPDMFVKDLVRNIQEGRANLMRLLLEEAERNGKIISSDVKGRYRVNIKPHDRLYLATGNYTVNDLKTEFKLTNYTRPTQSYPTSTGNPKVVGDIARIQEGDYIVLMFSFLDKDRTGTPAYVESYAKPVPEICKVLSVNRTEGTFVVQRNWAGAKRTTAPGTPPTLTVVPNSSTPTTNQVRAKDAFFLVMPNTMPENEIDQRIKNMTQTFDEFILQRTVRAWGTSRMVEIISQNLGIQSPGAQSKALAIEQFYKEWGRTALWGEKDEGFTDTGEWWGLTDGFLTNVDKSHFIGLVGINYSLIRSRPEKAWGSFDIPIFNKMLADKAYMMQGTPILICGENFYTDFVTMINYMTQNIPTIVSEWKVVGNRFRASSGIELEVIPSDEMSLNGMKNKAILAERESLRIINLQNYPTDIVEIQNENPLLENGFIHGVMGFVNTNPDGTYVFTLDPALRDATLASYNEYKLGIPQP